MKRLRTKLPYLKGIFLVLLVLLLSYFRLDTRRPDSSKKDVTATGIITKVIKKENQVTLEVKGKESFLVYTKKKVSFKLGNKVLVTGKRKKIQDKKVFHLFRYDLYMKSRKMIYQMTSDDIQVIGQSKRKILSIKQILIDWLDSYQESGYLKALLLGDQSGMDIDVKEELQFLGISHLFALSGMHVSILSGILIKIFSFLFKEKIAKRIVVIVLIGYLFFTDFPPSLVRASMLSILFLINLPCSKRRVLLILFSGLLLYNPYYLYHPGFLYSFTISFFLLSCTKLIQSQKGYFKKLLMINGIATLTSLPISLYFFFEWNVSAFFLNLFFVPFFSYLFFPITLLVCCCPFLDGLYSCFISCFETILSFCHPFSYFLTFPKITIIYYFLYELFLYFFLTSKKKIFLLFFCFFLFFHYQWMLFFGKMSITLLDVGQGDCTLITFAHNKGSVLIDTGGNATFKTSNVLKTIIPYLKAKGIRSLTTIVLTHGDFDHMGEAIHLVNHFRVENVILNCGEYNDLEKNFISVLEKKNIKYYSCIKEFNIDDYKLQFLNTKEYDNENDNSSVIYFHYNNYKFLFMGDAGVEKEKDILEKYNLKDIDFLKVGHHGSNTSSSKEFIDKLNPKYSLISVGRNNRYGHPKDSVLDILKNSKIYRTDLDGSIEIQRNKNGYHIRTCNP